jgi:hypothetical protein
LLGLLIPLVSLALEAAPATDLLFTADASALVVTGREEIQIRTLSTRKTEAIPIGQIKQCFAQGFFRGAQKFSLGAKNRSPSKRAGMDPTRANLRIKGH